MARSFDLWTDAGENSCRAFFWFVPLTRCAMVQYFPEQPPTASLLSRPCLGSVMHSYNCTADWQRVFQVLTLTSCSTFNSLFKVLIAFPSGKYHVRKGFKPDLAVLEPNIYKHKLNELADTLD